jgi:hypothetical protein
MCSYSPKELPTAIKLANSFDLSLQWLDQAFDSYCKENGHIPNYLILGTDRSEDYKILINPVVRILKDPSFFKEYSSIPIKIIETDRFACYFE